jgi:hypothetical protein
LKRVVVSTAVLALGIGGVGLAQAQSGFKVTGGGQALATSDGSSVRGPGDTYGFNAQDLDGNPMTDAAKGQFTTIQRTSGATTARGRGEQVRGEVNCLVPLSGGEDGAARFGGVVRGQEDAIDPLLFAVDVTDNGEGNAADDDMIVFRTFRQSELDDNENACDMEPEDEQEETILARGNVQIHNAG